MNRFFGFIKQKFVQAKQQNKQDLQNLANALTQVSPPIALTYNQSQYQYDSQKMQQRLQQIKANFAKWNIYIANQASTGLYYSQTHNRGVILKKIQYHKATKQSINKLKILNNQMSKTVQQLKQLNTLSSKWVNNISQSTQSLLKHTALQRKHSQQIKKNMKNQEKMEQKQLFKQGINQIQVLSSHIPIKQINPIVVEQICAQQQLNKQQETQNSQDKKQNKIQFNLSYPS